MTKENIKFEDLPIILDDTEYLGGWQRRISKIGTIKDLLEIWDINDESETSEIAQVLRHLRAQMARRKNENL